MRVMIALPCLVGFVTPALAAQQITQADLLARLIDLDRLSTPPLPGERTGLFSSFDRRQTTVRDGRYVHWDANEDRGQFLRRMPDDWNVMAEVESPGALTRIWCDEPTGDIRLILDGQAVIDAPFEDLFTGALEPFGMPLSYKIPPGGGACCCFPIGFAKSCRVLSRNFDGEYQIDYVAFPSGTSVERFAPELNAEAQAMLGRVVKTFTDGLSDKQLVGQRRTGAQAVQEELKAGDTLSWQVPGAGTIRALYVSMTDERLPRELYVLHNLILRVFWDGRPQPDIEVPLAAFFGTGYERHLYNSLVMGTDLGSKMPGASANEGWFMYCYFPMPFQDGARVEIQNLNTRPRKIGLMLYLRVDRGQPPKDALRFKVRMHTKDPCKTFDFPILETTGAGRIVGCVLNIDCPREQWWGEGDHKIWIDNEPFPSILGTSTAGYLGNVKGLRPFRMPLHGATRVSTLGKSSAYRWHTADCVDFHNAVRFALENWQYNQANDVYYNAVVYWYGQPGAADSFKPLSSNDLEVHGVRIPGAVEIEGNIVGDDWGNLYKQKHAQGMELSGKLAAAITTNEPVQIDLPCATALEQWHPGRYRLSLRVVPRRSFGTIEVRDADGKLIGAVEHDRQSNGTYLVGEITLKPGETRLIVQCSGSPSPILDCWILESAE